MNNAYQAGLLYELRAARYVRRRGYRLLNMRYRARDGEIDLIARDGDTIVFIEVKARPAGKLGAGVAAVTADKRRRLRHAAFKRYWAGVAALILSVAWLSMGWVQANCVWRKDYTISTDKEVGSLRVALGKRGYPSSAHSECSDFQMRKSHGYFNIFAY